MSQKAVRIHQYGGADVVKVEEIPIPEISDNQVLVKNNYAGVNFVDIVIRRGARNTPLPATLGREGTGVVVKAGSKTSFSVGDKVVYFGQSFAEYTAVEAVGQAIKISKIPEAIDEKDLAGGLLQGLTALTLTSRAIPIKNGDFVLVHAAAGGTGALIVQFAKKFGATVIGTTSSAEKAAVAKAAGADYVINYKTEDTVARVKEITNGNGVNGVFDGVGKDTWTASLASAARGATIVSFGASSGVVPPISIGSIDRNIRLVHPSLFNFFVTTEEYEVLSKELFDIILSGGIKFNVSKVYPLADTSKAISDLESGKTVGKLVISNST